MMTTATKAAWAIVLLSLLPGPSGAQTEGVLFEHPGTEDVVVRAGLEYSGTDEGHGTLDLYYPGPSGDSVLPAVVFVMAFPDSEEGSLKDHPQYPSWARLVAAEGMVGVLYEAPDPLLDLEAVLGFLRRRGPELGVDPERVALWSCSGNVPLALRQLRRESPVGLRALVAYYGIMPTADGFQAQALDSMAAQYEFPLPRPREDRYRTDVPMLVVRAGADDWAPILASIDRFTETALDENLPVTLVNYPSAPHGFDVSHDTPETRRVIGGTLEFLETRLDVPHDDGGP